MFRARTVRFNRWCGIAASMVACFSLCVDVQAQFHQTQLGPTTPLAPTIPGQLQPNPFATGNPNLSSSGLSIGNPDGSRSDSTIAGVRPLINATPNIGFGGQGRGSFPTSLPTSETAEPQGTGLPAISGRADGAQEPWQNDWRAPSMNPNTGSPTNSSSVGTSGLIPRIPGSATGFSGNNWTGPNSNSLLNTGQLLQQSSGEITAPGSRFLTADQTTTQRSSQSVAQRQAEIANNWDPYISLPSATGPGLRRGRSTTTGQDGLGDSMFTSQGGRALPEEPAITKATQVSNTEKDSQGATGQNDNQGDPSKASMDALSWWLMMCSVMANLILFYFLYDSRAKYLNLADELQSRFFREG